MTEERHENPFAPPESRDVVVPEPAVLRGLPTLLCVGVILYGGFTAILLNGGSGDVEVGKMFLVVLAWLIFGTIRGGFDHSRLPRMMAVATLIQAAVVGLIIYRSGMPHQTGMTILAVILLSMIVIGIHYAIRNRIRGNSRRRSVPSHRIFR